MLAHLFPLIYGVAVLLLLILAFRVMSKGFIASKTHKKGKLYFNQFTGDRTGQVTIHPELLNKEGRITDEDLLTVRFSQDIDPPRSMEKPSE